MSLPKLGNILIGDFWPEPVRVLTVQVLGNLTKIEAVGTRSQPQQFYSRILSAEDLARVRVEAQAGRDLKGNGEAFFLSMEAHRIRYAYQFDPLFAVNVSQVDPLPHQIEAIYHYILQNPRVRFLLADDPGAGKTIMTGLLLKELKYRGLVRRTLVVVPGHLKDQWLREMKDRFGETFIMVDRGVMNATWGRNVWRDQSQIVTSMDFAKQDDVMVALGDAHWDLVVVDEAHKMAAYRYGEKTNKTERYRFGETLSRIGTFLLFLTATPHRGDPENFLLFLDLLEPGLFANADMLAESVKNQDNPLFLRRLKEDLRDFDGRPLFPPRHVHTKRYRLGEDEKRLYNAVTEYVEKSYNKALASERRNVAFALLILQRRLASSVRAARRSLERRKVRLEELLELGKWLSERGTIDEDALEDAPEAERLRQEQDLAERLTAADTREELQAEIETLDQLVRLARETEKHEVETKLGELRKVMSDERIQQNKEKLLIFTESRDTLDYLAERLKDWGYSVVTLHGGMNLDARIRAEHEFRTTAQVMVSTEAGGEGINLHWACALMVNYDIPWNPNRLEQRMGRIHRYGQQKEVHIYNLVASDTREGAVLQAIFEKLESIQAALGSDRVFDVIGEKIAGRTLQELIVDAISQRRTLEEIVAEIRAIPDEEAVRKTREATLEMLATRHIDLQRVLGEDRRARENRLVPEYIKQFFERACNFAGIGIERRRDGLLRVPSVPYELRDVSHDFRMRFGEVFREYAKVAFDKQIARQQEAVFIAPGHPLLETAIDHLLDMCEQDVRRGAIFSDPDGQMDGWLWFVEGEVRDGSNAVTGKRLFAIHQTIQGEMRVVNSSVLWDLGPLKDTTATETPPSEDTVIAFAVTNVIESYRNDLFKQRERDAEIKRRYGLRSLEQMIGESDARLIDYETRRIKGDKLPEVEVQNEERRREELRARQQSLEEEIRRETSLLPSTPKVLGLVRVIPKAVEQEGMRYDPEVEAIGMRVAMQYERDHERLPEDVSKENLGYDIRSSALASAAEGRATDLRYIEVKARATTGAIVITPNEWLMAQRLGDEYWLYIVENAKSEPLLHTIQNPAAKFKAEEIVEIVRYVIKDWKNESK